MKIRALIGALVLFWLGLGADRLFSRTPPAPLTDKARHALEGLPGHRSVENPWDWTGGENHLQDLRDSRHVRTEAERADEALMMVASREYLEKGLAEPVDLKKDPQASTPILDPGVLMFSSRPEDLALVERLVEQQNAFGAERAIDILFGMGEEDKARAGLRKIASRKGLYGEEPYIDAAVRHLVNLGEWEWLEVYVDLASSKDRYERKIARSILSDYTGLKFKDDSCWQAWWKGVRAGKPNATGDECR